MNFWPFREFGRRKLPSWNFVALPQNETMALFGINTMPDEVMAYMADGFFDDEEKGLVEMVSRTFARAVARRKRVGVGDLGSWAAENGHVGLLRWMADKGDLFDHTKCMLSAARGGSIEVVDRIVR